MQLFIPRDDVGSLRVGKTRSEDERTDGRAGGRALVGSGEAGRVSLHITPSKERSLNSGWAWVGHLTVKDLKGKVVLCREGREGERRQERKTERKSQTKRSQGKRGRYAVKEVEGIGGEGSESTTETCVNPAHLRFRATVFLPSSRLLSSSPHLSPNAARSSPPPPPTPPAPAPPRKTTRPSRRPLLYILPFAFAPPRGTLRGLPVDRHAGSHVTSAPACAWQKDARHRM